MIGSGQIQIIIVSVNIKENKPEVNYLTTGLYKSEKRCVMLEKNTVIWNVSHSCLAALWLEHTINAEIFLLFVKEEISYLVIRSIPVDWQEGSHIVVYQELYAVHWQ